MSHIEMHQCNQREETLMANWCIWLSKICIYSVRISQKSILCKAVPSMVSLEEGVGLSAINAVIKFILLLLIKLCRQGEDINKYRVSDIGW